MRIILQLREDARTSLAAISSSINSPISTIHDRVRRLQEKRVVKKFTILVDFSKLGYHHHGKLIFKVNPLQKQALFAFLKDHPAVNSLTEINSGFDFFAEIIHHNVKEYYSFLDTLHESFELTELQEFQVIEDITREQFGLASHFTKLF